MSTIRISTNFNIDISFPGAPFHRRLIAWILDMVIIILYLRFLVSLILSMMQDIENNPFLEGVMLILIYVPFFTYHLFSEILMKGQSIGKKIMRIRVVNENGGRPAVSQILIRWMIRTSDFILLILILNGFNGDEDSFSLFWRTAVAFILFITDIILVNVTEKHQRLGDILAHTILIQTNQKAGFEETIFRSLKEDYIPSFPEIMQLSDRDVNALKGILDTSKKEKDHSLALRAAEKLQDHLKIQSNLPPIEFLEVLLQDYNYLSTH